MLVGRFASTALSRISIQYGTDVVFDVAGQVVGDLATGQPITLQSIAMGLAIGGVVRLSMGGLGRLARVRARVTAPGAEPPTTLGGRLAQGRLGRVAEGLTRLQQRSMAFGERVGARVGRIGTTAPTVEATRGALDFARQRIERGEFFPSRAEFEPVGWRGPGSRPPIGSIVSERPITLGSTRHTLRQIEFADGPRYILCTWCEPVLSRLQGIISSATDPAIQRRLGDLLREVQEVHVLESRFPDYDTRVNNAQRMIRIPAEADLLSGGGVYGTVTPGPRPSSLLDLPSDVPPALATRSRQLFPAHQRALRDYFRGTTKEPGLIPIPGGPQRARFIATLEDAIAAQARGRALVEAQEQILGPPQRLAPGAEARTIINPATDYPFGFYSRADFDAFGRQLRAQVPQPDAELFLTGSSVTGRRFQRVGPTGYTEAPFNVGRISKGGLSDFDVSIVSKGLWEAAAARPDIPKFGTGQTS